LVPPDASYSSTCSRTQSHGDGTYSPFSVMPVTIGR
jgi:hypothetical protein